MKPAPESLSAASLARAAQELARRDGALERVLRRHGEPPLWARRPGFPTLIRIILEQQVSLASGRACFDRLAAAVPSVRPRHVLGLGQARLRRLGFSRQKARYVDELASAIAERRVSLARVARLGDDEAREHLLAIKGVGPWSADVYLLMALRRPDIWPSGDLALATAVRRLWQLERRPTPSELDEMGQGWRPFRAVAARMLWQYYLSGFES